MIRWISWSAVPSVPISSHPGRPTAPSHQLLRRLLLRILMLRAHRRSHLPGPRINSPVLPDRTRFRFLLRRRRLHRLLHSISLSRVLRIKLPVPALQAARPMQRTHRPARRGRYLRPRVWKPLLVTFRLSPHRPRRLRRSNHLCRRHHNLEVHRARS